MLNNVNIITQPRGLLEDGTGDRINPLSEQYHVSSLYDNGTSYWQKSPSLSDQNTILIREQAFVALNLHKTGSNR